jgi:hypothetical protein
VVAPAEHFASYVPALVAQSLTADPPRVQPGLERFPAATLFADISGFTPSASRLAERGPAGAENLSRILNGYAGAAEAYLARWEAGNPEYAPPARQACAAIWTFSAGLYSVTACLQPLVTRGT